MGIAEDPKVGATEAKRAGDCKIWYAMVDLPGVPDKELHVRYSIDFELDALEELKLLRKGEQVEILKAVGMHLGYEPMRQSKSRIKHLRPGTRPPYRLRVDDFRIYYDVQTEERRVIVYG